MRVSIFFFTFSRSFRCLATAEVSRMNHPMKEMKFMKQLQKGMLTKSDMVVISSPAAQVRAAAVRRHPTLVTDIAVHTHNHHRIRVVQAMVAQGTATALLMQQDMALVLHTEQAMALLLLTEPVTPPVDIRDTVNKVCNWHHLIQVQAMDMLQCHHKQIGIPAMVALPCPQPGQVDAQQNHNPFWMHPPDVRLVLVAA